MTVVHLPIRPVQPPVAEFRSRAVQAPGRPALQIRPRSFEAGSWLSRLQTSFRETGGLATGDEVSALMRERCRQPLSILARRIVDGGVVSFEANGERWLPLFQFDPETLQVHHGVEQALGELRGVFDEAELAEWFATSNAWLGGMSPAALVASQPAAVIEAARADRFVAVG